MIHKSKDFYRRVFSHREMPDTILDKICQSLKSDEELTIVLNYIYQAQKRNPSKIISTWFIEVVDQSSHDLRDWCQSLITFDQYLKNANRSSHLEMMVGYMRCCQSDPSQTKIKQTLNSALSNMLELYGFLG